LVVRGLQIHKNWCILRSISLSVKLHSIVGVGGGSSSSDTTTTHKRKFIIDDDEDIIEQPKEKKTFATEQVSAPSSVVNIAIKSPISFHDDNNHQTVEDQSIIEMDYSNSNISFYNNNGLLENNEEDSNIFHQQYFPLSL
jgi:hypothetical protein